MPTRKRVNVSLEPLVHEEATEYSRGYASKFHIRYDFSKLLKDALMYFITKHPL